MDKYSFLNDDFLIEGNKTRVTKPTPPTQMAMLNTCIARAIVTHSLIHPTS